MHSFTVWFTSLNYAQLYGLAVAVFLVGMRRAVMKGWTHA